MITTILILVFVSCQTIISVLIAYKIFTLKPPEYKPLDRSPKKTRIEYEDPIYLTPDHDESILNKPGRGD